MKLFESKPKPPIVNPYHRARTLEAEALINRPVLEGEESLTQKVFAKLLTQEENRDCFDCGKFRSFET